MNKTVHNLRIYAIIPLSAIGVQLPHWWMAVITGMVIGLIAPFIDDYTEVK